MKKSKPKKELGKQIEALRKECGVLIYELKKITTKN